MESLFNRIVAACAIVVWILAIAVCGLIVTIVYANSNTEVVEFQYPSGCVKDHGVWACDAPRTVVSDVADPWSGLNVKSEHSTKCP